MAKLEALCVFSTRPRRARVTWLRSCRRTPARCHSLPQRGYVLQPRVGPPRAYPGVQVATRTTPTGLWQTIGPRLSSSGRLGQWRP